MFGGKDGRLDNEDVDSGVAGDLAEFQGVLWNRGDSGDPAKRFDLFDPFGDQFFFDRFKVDLLHQFYIFIFIDRGNLFEDFFRVFIARPNPVQVKNTETAIFTHQGGGLWADHTVHGGGDDRHFKLFPSDRDGDVGILRVDGDDRRDK